MGQGLGTHSHRAEDRRGEVRTGLSGQDRGGAWMVWFAYVFWCCRFWAELAEDKGYWDGIGIGIGIEIGMASYAWLPSYGVHDNIQRAGREELFVGAGLSRLNCCVVVCCGVVHDTRYVAAIVWLGARA